MRKLAIEFPVAIAQQRLAAHHRYRATLDINGIGVTGHFQRVPIPDDEIRNLARLDRTQLIIHTVEAKEGRPEDDIPSLPGEFLQKDTKQERNENLLINIL